MSETFWISFGMVGQAVFMARFLVQWLSSERQKRSMIPTAFWYLSLAGGSMLLIYAIHRREPVFALGQCFGTIVYVRNLQMIRKERLSRQHSAAPAAMEQEAGRPADSEPQTLQFPAGTRRAA